MYKNQFYLSVFFFTILLSAVSYAQDRTNVNIISKADSTSAPGFKAADTASSGIDMALFLFRQKLSDLYKSIKDRTKERSELINELNALMRDDLSKDPEFYNAVYIELPQLLQVWTSGNYLLYTVKPGDCLWRIANIYKIGSKWPRIFEANKEVIENPNFIYPSQLLKIPKSLIPNYVEATDIPAPDTLSNITAESKSIQKENNLVEKDSVITEDDLDIEGMVIDETVSKLGRDFYDLFYSKWESPEGAKNFTITIMEKPGPFSGTQVSIRVNDLDVYQNYLQPKYDLIDELAAQAVQDCASYLVNYKEIKKELQGEDMSGTGIY